MTPLLTIRNLKRHFGGLWATRDVSLEIQRGEIHALIGPNGAGKTTLIHLISGGLFADEGKLLFDGQDVTKKTMHERVSLGIARSFQITQIFPKIAALENVRLAVQARQRDWRNSLNMWRPASADFSMIEEAEDWLARVGLAEHAGTHAADLSHGEQRALELAMTLATRPRLLLLDEPLAGMGLEESERMTQLIASLRGEQAILLVEHDMDMVFRVADHISVLVAGHIAATGTPEAIRADPAVKRAYLGEDLA